MSMAIAAPTSSPLVISSASASATLSNRGSQCPCSTSCIGPSCGVGALLCSGNCEVAPAPERYVLPIRESHVEGGAVDAQTHDGGRRGRNGGRNDPDRTDSRGGSCSQIRPTPSLQCRAGPKVQPLDCYGHHGQHGLRSRLVLARRMARMGVLPMLTEHVREGGGSVRRHGGCGDDRRLGFCRSATQRLQPLPVDPNLITDSLAFSAAPFDIDPNGSAACRPSTPTAKVPPGRSPPPS